MINMFKLYKRKISNIKFKLLGEKTYIVKQYKNTRGIEPNLENPVGFGEKIQYIKLYGNLEKYSKMVCKYEVREFIKERIGEEYLINLIDVYDDVNKINFEKLPNQFVLKATHGSGYNIIVRDKNEMNLVEIKNKLNLWLKENFYYIGKERQYRDLTPYIICEEYMQDSSGELRDYKVFCFNGRPEFIQVDEGRFTDHRRDYYNLEWERLNLTAIHKQCDTILDKPKNLAKMIQLAEKISKDIPFVRVDFYNVDGKIYFGEMTFTPGNGMEEFTPISEEIRIGKLIDLDRYKCM